MRSDSQRVLVLQGGGSPGAYQAQYEKITKMDKEKGERDKPFLNTVDGTSIGAVNADIIVSYVVENDTWVGSAERVNEFWDICQRNHHLISSQRLIALKNFHYLEGPIISDTHVN